jgi:hypothetical protein
MLGPVDGFDEDETEGERDEGSEAPGRLLTPQGDALEALEFADGLLDPGPPAIEGLGEESRRAFGVRLVGNGRRDPTLSSERTVGLRIITFVRQGCPGCHVRSEIEQDWELRTVTGLTTRQAEGERSALEVALEMNLGREAPTRPTERLLGLPPFAPAAETWARTIVESNICTR